MISSQHNHDNYLDDFKSRSHGCRTVSQDQNVLIRGECDGTLRLVPQQYTHRGSCMLHKRRASSLELCLKSLRSNQAIPGGLARIMQLMLVI